MYYPGDIEHTHTFPLQAARLIFNRLMHTMASCICICRIETFASMFFRPGPVFIYVGIFLV